MTNLPHHIRLGRAKWYAWLRTTIEEKMIDETKLAKRINTKRASVINFKTEKSYPRKKMVEKINELLGGDIPYLHYVRKRRWMIKENSL